MLGSTVARCFLGERDVKHKKGDGVMASKVDSDKHLNTNSVISPSAPGKEQASQPFQAWVKTSKLKKDDGVCFLRFDSPIC